MWEGQEELLHIQCQEGQLWGDSPCPREGVVAALCWSSHEETPHVQGKRNPSKMVGVVRGHQRADTLNHNHRNLPIWSQGPQPCLTQWNWAMPRGATQDRWVMMERSDRMWSTGEGNAKPLQYSCLENPMNNMKRQNDRILKEELPRSVSAQYVTGDQWRNNSRKTKEMEPKQKQYPVADVTGGRSKVWCCKEQYYIGTWNVGSRQWVKANCKWSNRR